MIDVMIHNKPYYKFTRSPNSLVWLLFQLLLSRVTMGSVPTEPCSHAINR